MATLTTARQSLYDQVLGSIKNSPIKTIESEGNIYHFKLDYLLPYGECHYARIFSQLIYQKECLGIITPGDTLLETTSGSGGRAAAAIATALGYKIIIAIPAGGEKAREQAITKAGAELHLTPAEAYVNGFKMFILRFLATHPGTKYLNHIMGNIYGKGENINDTAINAFNPFIEEVLEAGINPDVVVCPLGNGTTTLPLATGFKSATLIGFESVSSALAYRKFYPGKYERIFGVDPKSLPRHDLPGTTPSSTIFPMPALEEAIPMLSVVALVTSNFVNNNFFNLTGFLPSDKSRWVAKWDDDDSEELSGFGRTGKAGFAVAKLYAQKYKLKNKSFLIPVFDASYHYDS